MMLMMMMMMTRSVKNEDLMVQAHWRLNSLSGWPLVVVVDLSPKKLLRPFVLLYLLYTTLNICVCHLFVIIII